MTGGRAGPDVFLVRHGATAWSTTMRHTGRTDIPLLPEGREEATAAGRLLTGRTFDLVLVSPMQRARQTCELTGYGDVAVVDDDLLEWDYGEAEGRTTAEMQQDHPGWSVWHSPMAGGETLDEVAARAERVVARARACRGDVALFAHGHILRVIAAVWCELGAPAAKRLRLETASVSVLGWEHDYPVLRALNLR